MATLQNLNFVPTSISGCALWLDAADSSTLVMSGTNVTQWRDKSGGGYNFTVLSGYSYPTLSTQSINSLNAVSFAGVASNRNVANQVLGNSTIPLNSSASGYSIFLVGRQNASHPSFTGYNYAMAAYNISPGLFYGTGPTNYLLTANGTAGPSFGFNDLTENVPNTLMTTTRLTSIAVSGSSLIPYLNGTAMTSKTGTCIALTGLTVGDANADNAGQNWGGVIGEVLVYNANLTQAQRQQLEGYLAWKWGLQGSLPSTHPFKLIAPNSAGLVYPTALSIPVPVQTFAVNPAPFVFNFSPTSISGCQLWLDAYDRNAVILGAGSNITRVIDKSPQNLTLTNAVSFTYDATNRAFVGPGGGGPVLGTATFSLPSPACMFIVGQLTLGYFFDGNSASKRMAALWNGGQYMGTVNTTIIFPSLGSNPWATRSVFQTVFNSGSSLLYTNGTVAQTPSLESVTLTGMTIGSRYTLVEEGLQGTINELIVYNSIPSTSQRQQMEGYLAWKWGLQASLPSNHPYRYAVPGQTITVPIPLISFQPASFRPTGIAGCSLWLDAADSATVLTSGSSLSQWNDKSGNGYNATALTGTTTYSSNAVVFSGSQILQTSLSSVNNTQTVFIIFSYNSTANMDLVGVKATVSQAGYQHSINVNQQYLYRFGGTLVLTGTTLSQNTRYLYSATINGGSTSFIYTNGSQTGSGGSTATVSGTGTVTLGGYYTTAGDQFLSGSINEVILYNSVLSTNNRQSIEGYLAWKWGLVGNLPANHPFKRFPPPPS